MPKHGMRLAENAHVSPVTLLPSNKLPERPPLNLKVVPPSAAEVNANPKTNPRCGLLPHAKACPLLCLPAPRVRTLTARVLCNRFARVTEGGVCQVRSLCCVSTLCQVLSCFGTIRHQGHANLYTVLGDVHLRVHLP
jgi:hypothetical protein